MEKMPQYVPSPEELKKAEGTMTKTQKELSTSREEALSAFDNIDKQTLDEICNLTLDWGERQETRNYYGKLNNHIINIHGNEKANKYTCEIDGKQVSENVAKELFDKINPIAANHEATNDNRRKIERELADTKEADVIACEILEKL